MRASSSALAHKWSYAGACSSRTPRRAREAGSRRRAPRASSRAAQRRSSAGRRARCRRRAASARAWSARGCVRNGRSRGGGRVHSEYSHAFVVAFHCLWSHSHRPRSIFHSCALRRDATVGVSQTVLVNVTPALLCWLWNATQTGAARASAAASEVVRRRIEALGTIPHGVAVGSTVSRLHTLLAHCPAHSEMSSRVFANSSGALSHKAARTAPTSCWWCAPAREQ